MVDLVSGGCKENKAVGRKNISAAERRPFAAPSATLVREYCRGSGEGVAESAHGSQKGKLMVARRVVRNSPSHAARKSRWNRKGVTVIRKNDLESSMTATII